MVRWLFCAGPGFLIAGDGELSALVLFMRLTANTNISTKPVSGYLPTTLYPFTLPLRIVLTRPCVVIQASAVPEHTTRSAC